MAAPLPSRQAGRAHPDTRNREGMAGLALRLILTGAHVRLRLVLRQLRAAARPLRIVSAAPCLVAALLIGRAPATTVARVANAPRALRTAPVPKQQPGEDFGCSAQG